MDSLPRVYLSEQRAQDGVRRFEKRKPRLVADCEDVEIVRAGGFDGDAARALDVGGAVGCSQNGASRARQPALGEMRRQQAAGCYDALRRDVQPHLRVPSGALFGQDGCVVGQHEIGLAHAVKMVYRLRRPRNHMARTRQNPVGVEQDSRVAVYQIFQPHNRRLGLAGRASGAFVFSHKSLLIAQALPSRLHSIAPSRLRAIALKLPDYRAV